MSLEPINIKLFYTFIIYQLEIIYLSIFNKVLLK